MLDNQGLDIMEEDVEEGSRLKLAKRDDSTDQQGGEMEASPAMPPPVQ